MIKAQDFKCHLVNELTGHQDRAVTPVMQQPRPTESLLRTQWSYLTLDSRVVVHALENKAKRDVLDLIRIEATGVHCGWVEGNKMQFKIAIQAGLELLPHPRFASCQSRV